MPSALSEDYRSRGCFAAGDWGHHGRDSTSVSVHNFFSILTSKPAHSAEAFCFALIYNLGNSGGIGFTVDRPHDLMVFNGTLGYPRT